ncbi:MAG: FKBP-type peptidyl-prolyl cis-trans isomerase [Bacteroidales bacterium]|jgi:gliding motility-associated peptidyl-prolyl isomerase|nr:FKBP-type peptidyl-prolyl cis-trans isomerase [Bacteroidales bacterium]
MKRFITNTLLFCLIVLLFSCKNSENQSEKKGTSYAETKESLVVANRYLTRTEEEEIEHYIKRHHLEVTETGSGLRYSVVKQGDGSFPQKGDVVTLEYKVRLITGDRIYSSDESGPLVFQVGKGGVPSGLEEAILHLKVGDQANIILPSHLAYGLLGDNNKVPKRATIIYEIEFKKLSKKQ